MWRGRVCRRRRKSKCKAPILVSTMLSGIRYNGAQTTIVGGDLWRAKVHIGTTSDADTAAPIGCPKTDTRTRAVDNEAVQKRQFPALGHTHARGRQVHQCGDCKRKYTADAEQQRFPEQTKRQAVQMRIEGASISAAARVVGASVASISGWVKRGRLRLTKCGHTWALKKKKSATPYGCGLWW